MSNTRLQATVPFYLECLGHPDRCLTGFSLSMWLFVRPTFSTGHIINAYRLIPYIGYNTLFTFYHTPYTTPHQRLQIHTISPVISCSLELPSVCQYIDLFFNNSILMTRYCYCCKQSIILLFDHSEIVNLSGISEPIEVILSVPGHSKKHVYILNRQFK